MKYTIHYLYHSPTDGGYHQKTAQIEAATAADAWAMWRVNSMVGADRISAENIRWAPELVKELPRCTSEGIKKYAWIIGSTECVIIRRSLEEFITRQKRMCFGGYHAEGEALLKRFNEMIISANRP